MIMRKLKGFAIIMCCVIGFSGCKIAGQTDTIELAEVSGYVIEKGYTEDEIAQKLKGEHRDNIIMSWGTPDGMLSGFWGEVWFIDDANDRKITLYYDADGFVENVRLTSVSDEKKLIYGDTSIAEETGMTKDDIKIELNSIDFSELMPGNEEKYSSDYYIVCDNAWLDYTITYERAAMNVIVGLRAEDGTEYIKEITGGSDRGKIEGIPAGTYEVFVRNSESNTEYQDTATETLGITGAMNFVAGQLLPDGVTYQGAVYDKGY